MTDYRIPWELLPDGMNDSLDEMGIEKLESGAQFTLT